MFVLEPEAGASRMEFRIQPGREQLLLHMTASGIFCLQKILCLGGASEAIGLGEKLDSSCQPHVL